MKYGQLIVDEKEHALLMRNMESSRSQEDKIYRDSIKKLKLELQTAKIMKETKMPEDVIRYNSIVTIRTPFNTQSSYQIVTPEKSNIQQNKISILSPMGLALFGYAKGDRIVWQFPSGTNEIEIVGVNQQDSLVKKEAL
ncbi:GreA/GreB family elongation factor [Flavobacterium sp. W1B]|uniref:GreA/GreB family elongation factor n=1 Tax=Flavobacterium sp. W1B TaxID=3394146 RepID=UPI0039BD8DD2